MTLWMALTLMMPAVTWTSSLVQPECLDQSELNDLVCDVVKLKELVKLVASRPSEKHIPKPGTKFSFYRHRDKEIRRYFQEDGVFFTCRDIRWPSYDPDEWSLFFDTSKRSLKCIFLHNVNLYGSIPIGHSVTATENFEATKELLELTRYDDLRWIVCVKVATLNFHAFFVYGIVL